jgi:hypothetical protein
VAGLVVIAVVVALIVAKSSSNTAPASSAAPASADVVHAVTSIPQSTFSAVGTGSGLAPPTPLHNQPPLVANGKPEVFYAGAEYCPYCAAERWSLVVALSRFGTFSNLKQTESSTTDVYPGTKTFSFYGSSYSSPYISFTPIELNTNQPNGNGGYTTLQTPTPEQERLISKYDEPPYVSQQSSGGIPLIIYGGKFVTSGASYSPQILQGLDMGTIAGSLSDPSTTPAKNIVAQANVETAMICKMTGGNPGRVCSTPVIQKAQASLPK